MRKSIATLITVLMAGCTNLPLAFDRAEPVDGTPFDTAVTELRVQLVKQVPDRTRLLILDLTDLNAMVTPLGSYIADKLTIQLATTHQVQLVDRKAMHYVLREQELQLSSTVDPQSAVSMGRMSGAELIVYGTISELANSIEITLRVVDVELGTVIGGASAKIPKSDESLDLIGVIVKEKTKQQALVEQYRASVVSEIDEDTLRRFEAIQRIHAEIDEINESVLSKLKIGMTLQQVRQILGEKNVHQVTSSGHVYMAGRYYLVLNGAVLIKVVDGKTVNDWSSAVVSGRNVARY